MARSRDPGRRHADVEGAAAVARRKLRLPSDRDRSRGRLERADLDGGADPARLPGGPRRFADRFARAPLRKRVVPPVAGRRPRCGDCHRRVPRLARRRTVRAARLPDDRTAASGRQHGLRLLQHAGAGSRDVPAGGRPAGPLPLQPRRKRNRRRDLLGPRRCSGRAGPDGRADRRPRPLSRHERPAGDEPSRRRGDDRRNEQPRWRDLRFPADRLPERRIRGAVRHSDRSRLLRGGGAVRPRVHQGRMPMQTSARRSPARGWWRSRSTDPATSSSTGSCSSGSRRRWQARPPSQRSCGPPGRAQAWHGLSALTARPGSAGGPGASPLSRQARPPGRSRPRRRPPHSSARCCR